MRVPGPARPELRRRLYRIQDTSLQYTIQEYRYYACCLPNTHLPRLDRIPGSYFPAVCVMCHKVCLCARARVPTYPPSARVCMCTAPHRTPSASCERGSNKSLSLSLPLSSLLQNIGMIFACVVDRWTDSVVGALNTNTKEPPCCA